MVEVARLSTPRIRRLVGEASVHKARAYTRLPAWSNLRVQGASVKGECRGTAPVPYRVEVEFDGQDLIQASCSCPVGAGGHCKHVAALLFVYRDHPEEFIEVEDLDTALERRTKGELIALVRRMIRRVPELELLLEAPLPGTPGAAAAGDPEPFRRQARAAFQHAGHDWNAVSLAARELHDIAATADEFRQRGELAAAAAAYRGVADVALDELEVVHDEDGDLLDVIAACAAGLAKCFEATPTDEPERREKLLRSLFDLYVIDENHGGLCAGDAILDVLVQQTTPEERRVIAGWIRAAAPRGHEWNDDYRRGQFGELLLRLEGDTLDDEEYLRVCRELGRVDELVDRLLQLERDEEAIAELEAAPDHRVLALADVFAQHGLEDEAERVVLVRVSRARPAVAGAMLDWSRRRAEARGDLPAARDLARRLFDLEQTLSRYEDLQRLTPADDWPAARTAIRAQLEQSGSHGLLLDLDLAEDRISEAIRRVRERPALRHRLQDVARAAEARSPRDAMELLQLAVEEFVQQRHRGAYRAACEPLAKLRALYRRLGDDSGWTAYMLTLRERHRALRAFREELDRAELT